MRKNKCAAILLIGVLLLCGCGGREPVIYAPDAQICAGEEYDELDGVAALDEIDGDLTKQVRLVRGDLDTDRPGRARLTYEATAAALPPAHRARSASCRETRALCAHGSSSAARRLSRFYAALRRFGRDEAQNDGNMRR